MRRSFGFIRRTGKALWNIGKRQFNRFRLRQTMTVNKLYNGEIRTVHGTFSPTSMTPLRTLPLRRIIRVSSFSANRIQDWLFWKFGNLKLWFYLRYQTSRKWPFSWFKIPLQCIDRKLETGQRVSDKSIIISHFFQGFLSTQYPIREMSREGVDIELFSSL